MLKFKVDGNTRTLIGLGLTEVNVARLQGGEPVLVKLDLLGIPSGYPKPVDILIIIGKDEPSLVKDIAEKLGLDVTSETSISIDPEDPETGGPYG